MKAELAFFITSIVLLLSEIVYVHAIRVKRVQVMSNRLAATFAGIGNLGFVFYVLFLSSHFQVFYPGILWLLAVGLIGLIYMGAIAKGVHIAVDSPETLKAIIERKLSEEPDIQERKTVLVHTNKLLGLISIKAEASRLRNLVAGLQELRDMPTPKRFPKYLLVCEGLCCFVVCVMLWFYLMLLKPISPDF